MIDPFTGGNVPVRYFLLAAERTANSTNADQPFMTLDLTFIYVLLTDGFGLKPTTQLSVSILFYTVSFRLKSWEILKFLLKLLKDHIILQTRKIILTSHYFISSLKFLN